MRPETAGKALVDAQGRRIVYLRLSLTDRCNFRCSYCSPGAPERRGAAMARADVARIVSVFARLGIRRVRLTGGEPTLRADLVEVVRDVASTPGVEEVALTTNGHLLGPLAAPLREAGLSRLNVSLDTLDPARLRRISGPAATLERIVRGIEAAQAAGYASLKLNVVVVRGQNEGELGELVRFAWRHGATPRFIELMPFGAGAPVAVAEVKRLLASQGVRLRPDPARGWGPAVHMRGEAEDGGRPVSGLVGFIGALSETFCDGCNRVRVAADGSLRACLGGRAQVPLLDLVHGGAPDEDLAARIRGALLAKGACHDLEAGAGALPSMLATGG